MRCAPARAARVLPSTMLPSHVYVHVPFCARRCAYCDFAIAVRSRVPVDEYLGALGRELDRRYPAAEQTWTAETLYFGGGTPSRLGADGVRRMFDLLRARVELAPDAEVTLEANPEDVTPDAVAAWRAAGVNRLSLGGQSFDDRVLAWMHRTHRSDAVRRAVHVARDGGLPRLSLDLIFAVPESLGRSWEHDLDEAIALEPDHLSLYGLTVEPHTPLARWAERGLAEQAPEERYEREFLHANARLREAGFEHYEVSNFARPGLRARHNGSYWRGVPYAGLGPSAHAFDGVTRRWNVASYAEWLRRVAAGDDPVAGEERLTPENRLAESVYLGLRTDGGLALAPGEDARVERWVDAGWAERLDDRLRLTPLGWLRLDALAADLTSLRSR